MYVKGRRCRVWYNSKCPVGNAGIKRQHNRPARARAGAAEFRGIDAAPGARARFRG